MWPALGIAEPGLTAVADDVFLSRRRTGGLCRAARRGCVRRELLRVAQRRRAGDRRRSVAALLRVRLAGTAAAQFLFRSGAGTPPPTPRSPSLGSIPWRITCWWASRKAGGRSCFSIRFGIERPTRCPTRWRPLAHFLAHRREGKVSPNEFFDPEWYSAQKGRADPAGPRSVRAVSGGRADRGLRALTEVRSGGLAASATWAGLPEFPPSAGSRPGTIRVRAVPVVARIAVAEVSAHAARRLAYSPAFARRAAWRSISACTAPADWPTNWS